jgi:2,3-bisphosphoglycerate-independent phosphoglycerate mutase
MKYVIIVGDGMADYPVESLGGRTPLMVALKPAMDQIARQGRNGRFCTIPDNYPTGSAVANLAILGYDSRRIFDGGEGRGVLEAASLGVSLETEDLALRVNLISLENGTIRSHSAGNITTQEAQVLIRDAQCHFRNWNLRLYPGLGYRHLLVLPKGQDALECFPPHNYLGQPFRPLMVKAQQPAAIPTADLLNRLTLESQPFLQAHPINTLRQEAGKLPANSLWPWAPGKRPTMETVQQRFGLTGAVITAVDLIKGMAIYAGMDVIPVEGATGFYDTNYEGKADAALDALPSHDLVYVHVEAPDEAGHERNLDLKIRCIEDLDRRLIRRILEGLRERGIRAVVAVLPDHPTPIVHGAHTRDPVPVAVWDPRVEPDAVQVYDEESAHSGEG